MEEAEGQILPLMQSFAPRLPSLDWCCQCMRALTYDPDIGPINHISKNPTHTVVSVKGEYTVWQLRTIQPEEERMPDVDHIHFFPHECENPTCDKIVQYDDEPCCFEHSPDEGSSVPGYSARAKAEQ